MTQSMSRAEAIRAAQAERAQKADAEDQAVLEADSRTGERAEPSPRPAASSSVARSSKSPALKLASGVALAAVIGAGGWMVWGNSSGDAGNVQSVAAGEDAA